MFSDPNPNNISRTLFKIQVVCLPHTMNLWKVNKCQRNVKLRMHLLGSQCIFEEVLWYLVMAFFEDITQSRYCK